MIKRIDKLGDTSRVPFFMKSLFNHSWIKTLREIDIDLKDIRYNGITQVESEEHFAQNVLHPQFEKFRLDDVHEIINKSANPEKELEKLLIHLKHVKEAHESNKNANRLSTALNLIDRNDFRKRPRYHALTFLVSAWKTQVNYIKKTIEVLEEIKSGYINEFEDKRNYEPSAPRNSILSDETLFFKLTVEYQKPNKRKILTEIRQTLIDQGLLLPQSKDAANTLRNFNRFFRKPDKKEQAPRPIIWNGTELGLKYLVKILTSSGIIEQNFTKKSNYYLTSKLFQRPDGGQFSEGRSKDDPSKSEKQKVDTILGCLPQQTTDI